MKDVYVDEKDGREIGLKYYVHGDHTVVGKIGVVFYRNAEGRLKAAIPHEVAPTISLEDRELFFAFLDGVKKVGIKLEKKRARIKRAKECCNLIFKLADALDSYICSGRCETCGRKREKCQYNEAHELIKKARGILNAD